MPFSYPPPFGAVGDYSADLNFTLGSTVNIQWSGQPSTATLWLFRDIDGITCTEWNLAATYCTRLLTSFQNQNSYSWTVQTYASSYDNKLEPYYFVMGPEPPRVSGISAFDSHYFNILPTGSSSASRSTTTSTSTYAVVTAGSSASAATSSAVTSSRASSAVSSSSPTSSSVASSSRSTSTITSGASSSTGTRAATSLGASGTSSASSSPTPTAIAGNSGLTTGTKAAIGVAVGVGIPLIALLAYIAWILSRKRSKKNETAAAATAAAVTPSNTTSAYQGYPELSHDAAIKQNIAELNGGSGKAGAYPTYNSNPPMSELPAQQQYQPPTTHYELPGEGIRR